MEMAVHTLFSFIYLTDIISLFMVLKKASQPRHNHTSVNCGYKKKGYTLPQMSIACVNIIKLIVL